MGTVVSVDESGPSLTVNDAQGTKHTFLVQPDADVTLGLQPAKLTELRPEIDSVTVSYSEEPDGGFVAAAIDAHRGTRHDRWAVLIGCQAYDDRGISRLPNANADAQLVYESLVNRYAMDDQWTLRLLDRNRKDVQQQFERFLAEVGREAQVIVYVAAHAYVGEDDNVYLAFTDFRLDDMADTGLPLDWLVSQLERCASEDKLLLLDVVHDGSGPDLERQPPLPDMLYKLKSTIRETEVIGSASAGQRGLDLPGANLSAFASFVAEGFSGAADGNEDLHVTADELHSYLRVRLESAALPGGREQTPFRLEGSAPDRPPGT
jgi:hypothetical protein